MIVHTVHPLRHTVSAPNGEPVLVTATLHIAVNFAEVGDVRHATDVRLAVDATSVCEDGDVVPTTVVDWNELTP